MTDPFSIGAGAAGLISLGIKATESLVKYYSSYKAQDADISHTSEKLESLLSTFECLSSALQSRNFRPDEQGLAKNIESSIGKCDVRIQQLQKKCEKCESTPATGTKSFIKNAGHRAAYPFRQSTLLKLDEAIGEIVDNLSLALEVLQISDHMSIQDDINEIKSLVDVVSARMFSATIRDWLKAPDATIDHNAACAKRHPGTGNWFVKGSVFSDWLTRENSFLWINGFAGSGKSVLCSTAIQHAFRHKRADRGVGIAFFYFSFNDNSKQDESAMLRALLPQLSAQNSGAESDLGQLYHSYLNETPPVTTLVTYLQRLISNFGQVYILLDALDESPRYGRRAHVLDTIETMRKWSLSGLHLLVTSRDEPDIRESLNPTSDEDVMLKNTEISQDICSFISGHLRTDRELRKLENYHERIQQVLIEGAKGV